MEIPAGVQALKSGDGGLGLRVGAVEVVEHNPYWADLFAGVADELRVALAGDRVGVEHIGSTSVEGLAAKPVLDIAIGIDPPIDEPAIIAKLGEVGFEFQTDLGDYGGLLFVVESQPGVVVSHLHVVATDNFQWRWYQAFRDGLRGDRALRDKYAELKKRAAVANPESRDGYNQDKFDWVLATVTDLTER